MPRLIIPTSADGLDTDWSVVGALPDWQVVLRGSSDAIFITSATATEKSTFFCGDGFMPAVGRMMAVTVHYRMRQTVAGAGAVVDVIGLRNFRDENVIGTVNLTTDQFVDGSVRVREDWLTNVRFTVAGANLLGVGVEVNAAPSSGAIEVSQLWVEAEYVDTPQVYDAYGGVTPDAVTGALVWSQLGNETAAIVADYLNIDDNDQLDSATFSRLEPTLQSRHVTEIETRQIVRSLPTASTKMISAIAERTDGARGVALCALKSSGDTYVGLIGDGGNRDDPNAYLDLVQVDLLDEDRHYRLRIDRDDDAQTPGMVQAFIDYAEAPSLEARYDQFSPVACGWDEKFPVTQIAPRITAASCYDSIRKEIVVFSGQTTFPVDGGNLLSGTWVYDGKNWTQKVTPVAPIPRRDSVMVFDPVRGECILFGGTDFNINTLYFDTWSWDGSVWKQLSPATTPPARMAQGMAFDPVNSRILMFGGRGWLVPNVSIKVLDDTWAWNGTDWTNLSPATTPPGRQWPSLGFDEQRGLGVLFGGTDVSFTAQNDTWEFNGTDWTQIFPVASPAIRRSARMWFDRYRIVIFGGTDDLVFDYNETWEYDGTTWTQITDPAPPGLRSDHALAYDSDRGVAVTTGGAFWIGGAPPLYSYPQDTWEYGGRGCSHMLFGPTGSLPNSDDTEIDVDHFSWQDSNKHGDVFSGWRDFSRGTNEVVADTEDADVVRPQRIIPPGLSIGQSNAALRLDVNDETVECQVEQIDAVRRTGWIQVENHEVISKRFQHGMAYDVDRKVAVLFGGLGLSTAFNDTWEYNGSFWTKVITTTAPSIRLAMPIVYDSARKKIVLFGGVDVLFGTVSNETWEYDGTDWTKITTSTTPAGRYWHGMAYDSVRNLTVMYGGWDNVLEYKDTWEYDGTDWTLRSPATDPGFRSGHGLAYDSDRQVVIMFAGFETTTDINETWEYDGTDWTQIFPAAPPPVREQNGIVYCPVIKKTIIFGGAGLPPPTVHADTWLYDGTNWTQKFPSVAPPARWGLTLVCLPEENRLFTHAGRNVALLFDDTWEYELLHQDDKTYKLDLDYRSSDTNARARVTLQRTSDLFYWDEGGSAWQAAPSSVTLAFSATRTRASVMTGIDPNPTSSPEVWRVRLDYDDLGMTPPETVRVYKAYLKEE